MAVSEVFALSTSTGSSKSPSCAFGASYTPVANDLVILFITVQNTTSTLSATPSGWVNPLGSATALVGSSHQAAVCYHFVTSAEATAGTTTYSPTNWFTAAATCAIVGVVFRGTDTANPVQVSNTVINNTTSTTHVMPGLTGPGSNSMPVGFVCASNTPTYTDPTGWTLNAKNVAAQQGRASYRSNTLTTAGSNVASQNVTASSTGLAIGISLAIAPPNTGSAAVNLQMATAALSGSQIQSGTVASALQMAQAAMTGAQAQSGSVASSMQSATASLSGAQTQSGAVASTLQMATAALSGSEIYAGIVSAALQMATASLSGIQEFTGTAAMAFLPPIAALSGAQEQSGTLSTALQALILSGDGLQAVNGTVVAALQVTQADAAGAQIQFGSMNASLQDVIGQFFGTENLTGVIAVDLRPALSSGTGGQLIGGALAAILQVATFFTPLPTPPDRILVIATEDDVLIVALTDGPTLIGADDGPTIAPQDGIVLVMPADNTRRVL